MTVAPNVHASYPYRELSRATRLRWTSLYPTRTIIRMPRLLAPRFFALSVSALLLTLGLSGVALGQPALTVATSAAVTPGGESEVHFTGSKLEGPLRFWSSFPAEIQILEQAPDGNLVKCKVIVGADVPVGVGGILLANHQGVTDTLWVMVDDLATVAEASDNQRPETAQPLTLPIAVDGVANGPEPDYFRFDAEVGQLVSLEVYAARMGSSCDPVLRILDSAGEELHMVDDDVALGADCRLTMTIPAAGTYFVELRDSRYASGGRYRLRIGDFPDTSVALPAGVRRGTLTEVNFPGQLSPGATQLVRSHQLPLGVHTLSVKREGGDVATPVPLIVSDLPEYVESEPNNTPETATRISIPSGFSGILEQGARDYFEFLASEGDRIEFQSLARTIGSPAYPFLRLSDVGGRQIAESPVGESDELTLAHTFPADGIYRLSVEDLLRGGGPQHAYRIEARRTPFTVAYKTANAVPYKATLDSGIGAWVVDVTCQRHGYDGPISFRLDPPSLYLEWVNSTIPEKANEGKLVLAVREGTPPGELATVQLLGDAVVRGIPYSASVSSLTSIRAKWPMIISPPVWHRDLLAFSTGPMPPPFFENTLATPKVFYPRGIGQSAAQLTTQRLDAEFKDAVPVVMTQGPPGVTAEFKTEGDVHDVTFHGPKDLPVGTYPVELTSWGSLKGRSIVQRTRVLVDVQDPVTIAFPDLEPLKPGESRKLLITADRQGAERHPVEVTFPELPAGVTVPSVTLPADQDQVEVELSLAAEAMPGRLGRLTAQAASRYLEQDVTSRSSLVLQVQAP